MSVGFVAIAAFLAYHRVTFHQRLVLGPAAPQGGGGAVACAVASTAVADDAVGWLRSFRSLIGPHLPFPCFSLVTPRIAVPLVVAWPFVYAALQALIVWANTLVYGGRPASATGS